MTREEILKGPPPFNDQGGYGKIYVLEAMQLYAISILKEHIEHPNKPGYRRHDILERIKQLEEEYDKEG